LKSAGRISIALIFALSITGGIIKADRLIYNVIPSEEELLEAYLRGDIAYQDYLDLTGLIRDGADSIEANILEAIAGGSRFLRNCLAEDSIRTENQWGQSGRGIAPSGGRNKAGFLRFSRYQELSEKGENRGRLIMKTALGKRWTLNIGFDEDSGNPGRITRRSLSFSDKDHLFKKMVFGNYTARWGLGLTVGRFGKTLNKGGMSGSQSLAYPDYSGFNGAYFEGGRCISGVTAMIHTDGDSLFKSGAAAVGYLRQYGHVKAGGILSAMLVQNKETGATYRSHYLGTHCRYAKSNFNAAAEVSIRVRTPLRLSSILIESKCKNELLTWQVSAWHYGDTVPNLVGGGYAGSLYRQVIIAPVGLTFSSKRCRQQGILLKSRATVSERISHELSLTVYGGDSSFIASKISSMVETQLTRNSIAYADFRYNREEEWSRVEKDSEVGAGYRLKSRKYKLYGHIGYIRIAKGVPYFSCFARMKSVFSSFGIIELWINIDKISIDSGRADYLYGYLRESVALTESLELGAKYSYRYGRSFEKQDKASFWFEARWAW
jgi:hypothetical protein